jgi:hypothetical protein
MEESRAINQGLFQLGNVIAALSDRYVAANVLSFFLYSKVRYLCTVLVCCSTLLFPVDSAAAYRYCRYCVYCECVQYVIAV